MTFSIANPNLWTPETPYLYIARIKYMRNGQTVDEVCQKFGIRTVKCSKEGGFQLVPWGLPSTKVPSSDRSRP